MSRTTGKVLSDAEETLATASISVPDLKDPAKVRFAIRNVVVWGRAFTNVLQNLRSVEGDFDAWYEPYRAEMAADPLMRYFYKLRSEILKQGQLRTSTGAHIRNFNPAQDLARLTPPPNAKSFFIGDQNGGSGWEIELPDGTTEKFYVSLPSDIGETWLTLSEAPEQHLGKELPNNKIDDLAALYLDYLHIMLVDAKQKFGKDGA